VIMEIPKWHSVVEYLRQITVPEVSVHNHVGEERAHLFSAFPDGGVTEFEYLNFLHALVLTLKPHNVLETGTSQGFGTVAIAAGLNYNGFGRVTTLDINDGGHLAVLAQQYGLEEHICFVQQNSLDFIQQYQGEPFDFAFFDSDVAIRHLEYKLLWERNKVHGFVAFHDTSRWRCASDVPNHPDYLPGLDQLLPHSLELPLSRGLRVAEV